MRALLSFVGYRLFRALITLWIVSTVVFVVMRLSGDPVPRLLPPDAPRSESFRVRAELGFPPLVTPTSQIIGTQAVLNVVTGQRYKVVPKEVKAYIKGMYGRPPGPIDPAIQRLILGDDRPITSRPADGLEPELDKARA